MGLNRINGRGLCETRYKMAASRISKPISYMFVDLFFPGLGCHQLLFYDVQGESLVESCLDGHIGSPIVSVCECFRVVGLLGGFSRVVFKKISPVGQESINLILDIYLKE